MTVQGRVQYELIQKYVKGSRHELETVDRLL